MEAQTETRNEKNKKARNTIGLLLTLVMLCLTIYVLYVQTENYKTLETTTDLSLNSNDKQSVNYRHYVKAYLTTRQQLVDTQARLSKMTLELELVNKELESAKSMLSETQTLLAQSQQENQLMKGDPKAAANLKSYAAKNNREAVQNVDSLKKKNENYSSELAKLKSDLNGYGDNVHDLKQGSSLINEFKDKIRIVKDKMRALKKQAYEAKIAAQEERDRQLAALGNNGFTTKDGQLTFASKSAKSVNIDVKFVP